MLLALALCLGGISAGAAPVPAAHAAESIQLAQGQQQQQQPLTLAQATRMVRERTGGRILRADTVRQDGRVVYVFRVLVNEVTVREVRVDAASGRIQ